MKSKIQSELILIWGTYHINIMLTKCDVLLTHIFIHIHTCMYIYIYILYTLNQKHTLMGFNSSNTYPWCLCKYPGLRLWGHWCWRNCMVQWCSRNDWLSCFVFQLTFASSDPLLASDQSGGMHDVIINHKILYNITRQEGRFGREEKLAECWKHVH